MQINKQNLSYKVLCQVNVWIITLKIILTIIIYKCDMRFQIFTQK